MKLITVEEVLERIRNPILENVKLIVNDSEKEVRGFELKHPHFVYGVSFSPDRKYLATGCYDRKARIIRLPNLK
ncbi:MAG: WD40 repeat domain-containing protein [Nanoarchaeota archaeon]|nr:WD40 repeat domain-containing protein [Nanoarchaeota archaeon]